MEKGRVVYLVWEDLKELESLFPSIERSERRLRFRLDHLGRDFDTLLCLSFTNIITDFQGNFCLEILFFKSFNFLIEIVFT